jgi:hypothetical protein
MLPEARRGPLGADLARTCPLAVPTVAAAHRKSRLAGVLSVRKPANGMTS